MSETQSNGIQPVKSVLYRSRFVSGSRIQSPWWQTQRVNNGLDVIITTRSIRIDANIFCYFLRPVLKSMGLILEIPTANIQSVTRKRLFLLTEFHITFLDDSGQENAIELLPWNTQRFQNAVNQLGFANE